ncbi:polyprenol monophosphomannose synthase [Nocardioides marmoriginsengisoli]|uniref:Polyprenol monophosphomannose synthase n=1 Tax=Nocardioides marmoriginsengisoli TaxID=661483 RepID=A0A3N0CPQ4_9ACTN|nr:polyprenol monophosphomannose synthase [Nocardioides marmoriginsengisoli]RNL65319.1 polyprenol monophosphomannose synthase [Nocardioides marmoriginsengisoli]
MTSGPGATASTPRRVVVVPTYNEAPNVLRAIDAVLAAAPECHVLVVDDNSPDGTGPLVAAHPDFGNRVHLLGRPGRGGLGAAYRAGFAWAFDHGYEQIAQMDADLSHPPDRLPALFAALDDADVAVGSRYVRGGGVKRWGWHRQLISRGGNLYVRLLLGTPVRDTTAGFKAFRAEALRTIDVLASESNGYSFQIENTWNATRRGLRITEVPITFTDRTAGASKMSGSIAREALGLVLRWRIAEIRGREPRARRRTAA